MIEMIHVVRLNTMNWRSLIPRHSVSTSNYVHEEILSIIGSSLTVRLRFSTSWLDVYTSSQFIIRHLTKGMHATEGWSWKSSTLCHSCLTFAKKHCQIIARLYRKAIVTIKCSCLNAYLKSASLCHVLLLFVLKFVGICERHCEDWFFFSGLRSGAGLTTCNLDQKHEKSLRRWQNWCAILWPFIQLNASRRELPIWSQSDSKV